MTILDQIPVPGSQLENAFRVIAKEERQAERAALERAAANAARRQGHADAEAYAQLVGHGGAPTHFEVLQAASALADLEDAAEERMKAKASSRAEALADTALNLRSQLDAAHRHENARSAVDAARVKSVERHAARARSEQSLRYR